MPQITLDLDQSVLEQLRRRAHAEQKSMGQVASERLAVSLANETAAEASTFKWPTWHMGRPKIDLEDKDRLAALSSGHDGCAPLA